jgi:hypothetical protein
MNKLEDILEPIFEAYGEAPELVVSQVKRDVKALILGLIGEDETAATVRAVNRDKLRRELRNKVKPYDRPAPPVSHPT